MASKIKEENYVVIQGWMISNLKLKGNELIVYAIIYGFSQTEGQLFNGSLQYLADWTNSTKQGVSKNLKSLIEKGYIQKNEKFINGVKFCEYYTTKFNDGMQQSLIPPMQQSLTNNKEIDNINNIINRVIEYMNNCGETEKFKVKRKFNFNPKASSNIKIIKARINEGYTLDDFKDVIFNAYDKFIENEYVGLNGKPSIQYYNPNTIFTSSKMEKYKNEYENL